MSLSCYETSLPGPLVIDVAGLSLTAAEKARIAHPFVGGVILFARNFSDAAQLRTLTQDIVAVKTPAPFICVDQEGGRVQRFRENGFTALPAMRHLGQLFSTDADAALALAFDTGVVLAAELRAQGVDFSFAPVLDLDYGVSRAIGDRAFHRHPDIVIRLATALAQGMHTVGMGCIGKHFPGHGYVEADSHVAWPLDTRSFEQIWQQDLLPYRSSLVELLLGVMPAHVQYPNIDQYPAGFSPFWLQRILRQRIGFQGVIFSDDLTMEGASWAGDITARVQAAYHAGCDMVLVCNRPDLVDQVLEEWAPPVGHNVDRLRHFYVQQCCHRQRHDELQYQQSRVNLAAFAEKQEHA